MMYTALEVARHIIKYANDKGLPCSNLKLQKILYFVQAEFLVVKNQKCFEDKILACDFGSFVESVWDEYKIFGGCNISDQEIYLKNIKGFDYKDNEISEEDKKLIDGVVDETIVYSNSRLGDFIHSQAPWQEAYTPFYKQEIICESLKNFFKEGDTMQYNLEFVKEKLIPTIKEVYEDVNKKDFTIDKKSNGNFVTSVDTSIEKQLKAKLSKLVPNSGFLCEESESDTSDIYNWIIDPIDGTTNFLYGYTFTISVALTKKDINNPILAVIYSPREDKVYYSAKGQGSYVLEGNNIKKLEVHDVTEEGISIYGMPYNRKKTSKILHLVEKS